MNRRAELNSRLYPYCEVPIDREETLNSLPVNIWSKLLRDVPKLTGLCDYWFKAGILRAITELQAKHEDGQPLYRSRQQLIDHLKTINRP